MNRNVSMQLELEYYSLTARAVCKDRPLKDKAGQLITHIKSSKRTKNFQKVLMNAGRMKSHYEDQIDLSNSFLLNLGRNIRTSSNSNLVSEILIMTWQYLCKRTEIRSHANC
jgi:phenylalanyl-tRNA synthetase beta subunit